MVLAPGRISLQLSTEVSELTNTGVVHAAGRRPPRNGLTIPGACRCAAPQTTVELPSGGSFAIAGLMQHNTKQVIDGFPGVKDLPVLGALFRSRDFQNDETELVVLVSAYLVEPDAGSALCRADRRLRRADRSGNHPAGPPERDLQEEDDKPPTPQASGACRLHRAIGGQP